MLGANSKSRPTIYLRSQASKILFNKGKVATGVVVTTNNRTYVLSAKKEVILSAGVFHPPQLLMLSGFGPADVLSSNAVPVISALSGVGQNLWDQIFLNALHGITVLNTGTYVSTLAQQAIPLQQYYANAPGPYSSARGYLSFEKIPVKDRKNFSACTSKALAHFPSEWPEIKYVAPGFPSGSLDFPTIGAISAILLTPILRGNVTIRSASIEDAPVINLG